MKIRDYRARFIDRLLKVTDADEAQSIFYIVLEHLMNLNRVGLALSPDAELTPEQLAAWDAVLTRLFASEPVQYILGETHFFGRRFHVTPDVLIPRPETEELVQWITDDHAGRETTILDIGTGSGCIAISLALSMQSKVSALDISASALEIARKNANQLGACVKFIEADIRSYRSQNQYDVIVSNPPYVRHLEKQEIKANVLEFEPHLALFVEDDDALLFYRKIAQFAQNALKPGGHLYFEINQYLGPETVQLLQELNFADVQLRRDIHQNNRMIRAVKPYS